MNPRSSSPQGDSASQRSRFDLPAIRDRNDLADVVGRTVALKQRSRQKVGCCPFHAEKTGSFCVYGSGATAHYHCFGCGAHGDVIGFVMRNDDMSFVEACRMLTEAGGLDDPKVVERARARAAAMLAQAQAIEAQRRAAQLHKSRGIWRETETVVNQDGARRYFASRNIEISRLPGGRLPDDIRYHPGLDYWWTPSGSSSAERDSPPQTTSGQPRILAVVPAIVAAVRGADFKGIGIEITYLNPTGYGKAEVVDPETGEILPAKKMRGNPWGGAVRLGPVASRMGFCEGKESGLSVMMADNSLPVWACLSIGNLAGHGLGRGRRIATPNDPTRKFRFLPSTVPDLDQPAFLPPPQCRNAILLEDNDNADPEAADAQYTCAAARWVAAGVQVSRVRPPAGLDFNDVLQGKAA